MKEYFSHDYYTRNKTSLSVLIYTHKMAGYGLFWIIVEMLYEKPENWLNLDISTYIAIAKETGCDVEFVEKFVHQGIKEFKVFIEKDGKFTTERVLENMQIRLGISEKRSKAGKASALAKQMSTLVEQTPTKERKVKEKKIRINTVFLPPSEIEVREYFKQNGYTENSGSTAFKYYNEAKWHDSKGNAVKNWKQKMISVWFKDNNKISVDLFSAGSSANSSTLSARELHDQKILNG